jgi:4-amino-4-deoxy-L-arabinose transferase-like glycosyltransferase
MLRETTKSPFWSVGRIGCALGCIAFLLVLGTLAGPGITVDEPLDVRPGRTYVATLRAKGLRFFDPEVVDGVYRDNAEHPPLGRWLLGVASTLGEPFEVILRGPDPVGVYVRSGRLAPAAAFAILVAIVSIAAGRRYGPAAATGAGLSLILMPRLFAHAHLAALDSFVALFWTAALLSAERALRSARPTLAMAGAGVSWSLILLTKIHGWLLPPLVLVWTFRQLPIRRAVPAFAAWTGVGIALFVLGWPWLWYEPRRLVAYLNTGVVRSTIHVQYFHHVYADRDVPWHYPWVYFAVTVPVAFQVLGAIGIAQAWRNRRSEQFLILCAGAIGLFLMVFSTRVPVYDGERLFLPAFPLWAIFIGRGFETLWFWTATRRLSRLIAVAAIAIPTLWAQSIHPFGLSYHNELVGGLRGAERLGLELTFWGDAVDGVLLQRLVQEAAPSASAALAPTLAPGQGLYATTLAMAKQHVILRDEAAASSADWVAIYRRQAYWKPEIVKLTRSPAVFLRTRDGVWLSGLWKRDGEITNRGGAKSSDNARSDEVSKFFRKN